VGEEVDIGAMTEVREEIVLGGDFDMGRNVSDGGEIILGPGGKGIEAWFG